MDLNLFFSFQGRINRAKYWLVTLIWLAVWILVGTLLVAAMFTTESWLVPGVIGLVVIIPAIVSGVSVGIRRLHDRDKTGWWLVLFYLVPSVLQSGGGPQAGIGLLLTLAGLAIAIWAIVELGCLPGTAGPNQYGPDPLAGIARQSA
jgi:uncharacterized membrane protein YhaH (DUF805 family)